MIWALIGILVGVIIGILINFDIPLNLVKYSAIIVISLLTTISELGKNELLKEEISTKRILIEISILTLAAVIFTLLGENLGVDFFFAITIFFTYKIFKNLEKIIKEISKN